MNNKLEESLNNLYVNISLINNETIRDKSFEDLEIIRKDLYKLSKYEELEEICKKISKQPIYKKCLDIIYCQVYIGLNITYNFLTNCIEVYDPIYCRRDALSVDKYGIEWAFSNEELER